MPVDLSGALNTATVEGRGIRITVLNEVGEPYRDEAGNVATALVAGTYSKRFLDAQGKAETRALRGFDQTAQERQQTARETFGACVIEWDFVRDGKPAVPAEVFALLPHVYRQIIEAAGDHAAHHRAYEAAQREAVPSSAPAAQLPAEEVR